MTGVIQILSALHGQFIMLKAMMIKSGRRNRTNYVVFMHDYNKEGSLVSPRSVSDNACILAVALFAAVPNIMTLSHTPKAVTYMQRRTEN